MRTPWPGAQAKDGAHDVPEVSSSLALRRSVWAGRNSDMNALVNRVTPGRLSSPLRLPLLSGLRESRDALHECGNCLAVHSRLRPPRGRGMTPNALAPASSTTPCSMPVSRPPRELVVVQARLAADHPPHAGRAAGPEGTVRQRKRRRCRSSGRRS